jgi:hypothetical protein
MLVELPPVGTLVRLELANGLVLPSRVEDASDALLALARPTYIGDVEPPRPGDELGVHWTGRRGVCSLPAMFRSVEQGRVPQWHLEVAGSVEVVQRRRYVRAATAAPVSLQADDFVEGVRVGSLLDISEGGIRLRVTRSAGRTAEEVVVRLAIEGQVVDVPGTILRTEPHGSFEEVVVEFAEDHRAAATIRRFVYAEQARQRRAGAV